MRAEALFAELDVLQELRPKAKAAMIAEARRQPGWKILRSVPLLGPVRVAEILPQRTNRVLAEREREVGA